MSTDIDQLLRDTLQGRAATVTEAPAAPAPTGAATHRDGRSRWLPVAATVAAVLVAGGGVTVWGFERGNSSVQSGGGYPHTCAAALPAAWKTAFAGPHLTLDGHDTSVVALTQFGDVVSWTTGTRKLVAHVGLRASDGTTRTVFVGAPGDGVTASIDGPDLALSVAPNDSEGPDVQDIVAVDLRDLRVQHVLARAAMPTGTVVGDSTAAVLAGTVYWTAVPRGTQEHPSTGTVLAYVLATGRTQVVGHATSLSSASARGVFWTGGGVAARGLPAAVPGPRIGDFNDAVANRPYFAWAGGGDHQILGWADSRGDARQVVVDTVGVDRLADPVAVSGYYVFLLPLGYNNPDLFVLDMRTGAVADSGIRTTGAGAALGTRVAVGTRAVDAAPFATVVLNTSHLPELHCR